MKYSASFPPLESRGALPKSCSVLSVLSLLSVSRRTLEFFVSLPMVGTGKHPGTAGGVVSRGSRLWLRLVFCAARGDHWDVVSVSVTGDRVWEDNSTQIG